MNIYLFSEDMYFHAGLNDLVEKEYGISVKLITIRMMMNSHKNGFIMEDDVFMIAAGGFNFTMSILVMLDYFCCRAYILPYDKNGLLNTNLFSSFLSCKVDENYIKSIVKGHVISNLPKMCKLSYKEASVLSYRLQGIDVYNLSRLLAVSIKTVYTQQENALKKLGVRTLSHLHMI
ncbi:helix-turn-helix transcriptional regulator [Serratia sp. T13T92]|uniref:helix-turn-helix transcriptional regulator n=1 Tax=Serratia sp. T13T92 TaxID=3397496 RepID=UPI0039DFB528